jgi:hypothetical protein
MFDTRANPIKQNISSVHQELKLSDQLEANLAAISNELTQLREDLEKSNSERDGLKI